MRLVYVVDSFMIGGSELAALRTVRLLQQAADISVVHFQTAGPLLEEYKATGVDMHHLRLHGVTDVRNLGAFRRLGGLIRDLRPDVVHSHDAYSNMVVLASQWPRFRQPWIASRRWLDQIVRPLHAKLNHLAFQRCSAVTVNSASVATLMREAEKIPQEKLAVIPNFVEMPADWGEFPSDRRQDVTIGMVSRLTPVKRHDVALAAMRRVIDSGMPARLLIVGDGGARDSIKQKIAALDLQEHVTMLGEQRGGPRIHLQFDIALSASDSEGSPNSVLEAMAAGRPAVATDVGGTRDLIEHGTNGLLVPAGDVEGMSSALGRMISDTRLRRDLGAAARSAAAAEYSPAAVGKSLMTLYENVKHTRQRQVSRAG